jgi:hypothetical protein
LKRQRVDAAGGSTGAMFSDRDVSALRRKHAECIQSMSGLFSSTSDAATGSSSGSRKRK